ncbi:MAG: hypothetical protein J6Y17_03945 [Elusimicrobiaceae bacterium]|nr:hypothetical protein [Elusimicrobiaceae bacterium]
MQAGIFPNLQATCKKQDNACVGQNFMYTGQCNVEKCTLNVAHLKTNSSAQYSLDQIDYMFSMQVQPKNVDMWKRMCVYKTQLGQQVCMYLKERGWYVKPFGK